MTASPLERLVDLLGRAGEAPSAEELADILWLAARLPADGGDGAPAPAAPPAIPPPIPPARVRQSLPPSRSEMFGQTAAASAAATRGSATADLYPSQAQTAAGGTSARAFRSPGAFALPGSLELGRSLRPLKRRVPSRVRMVLDEVATAHRIADTGYWMPVFSRAPERWLDVVLVVDESSSMIIWQRTLAELQRLLERQGAFRRVEVLGFRAAAGHRQVEIYTGIGPSAQLARLRRPAELIDAQGRRLIAVVSDCVSPVWHNGVMAALLHTWGQAGLAALVQVLPDRLWVRTGLRTFPAAYVRSPAPGAANATYEIEWTNYRPRPGTKGTAVPVASLEALPLEHWARALAGNSNLWIPAAFAVSAARPEPGPSAATSARAAEPLGADQLVRVFYGTASPTARRLASFLAAAPLTLPVMRLVQRALLPESRQVHLAEVWLSGLIDRPSEVDRTRPADSIEYFFVNGVRELLLNNLTLGDMLAVLNAVSGYVGDRLGQALDFGALMADPHASGPLQISRGYQSFARVAAGALRKFGGQYADLAQRLEISVYGGSTAVVEAQPEVRIERPEHRAQPRKHKVRVRGLLVGISEFASISMPKLQGTENDVQVTRTWLQESCGVAASDIVILLDRYASRDAIGTAWSRIAKAVEPGDQVFFYFSGYDQQIASNDPAEADGLEETLVVYDSISGERETLLTHQDIANLAATVEGRGGVTIAVLDSCRTASGLLARRALPNTLVFAAASEMEYSFESQMDGRYHGAVTYFLGEAMRGYRPGMTWLDVYDQVLARTRSSSNQQTPQLIGPGDLTVFGSERRPVVPYVVVTKANDREIEVHAAAALFAGASEYGARLAIFPPGSAMEEPPLGYARVTRSTDSGVAAKLESPLTVPLASRVRIVDQGAARPVLRVALSGELRSRIEDSSLVTFRKEGARDDLTVSIEGGTAAMYDRERREVWRDRTEGGVDASAERVGAVLHHVAAYLRALGLQNAEAGPDLAEKVDLELAAPGTGDRVTLAGDEPLALRLRNRSAVNLYISVWMFDDRLGIERIFPATTACVVLGKYRDVTLAVNVRPYREPAEPVHLTFKVFASRQPADLGPLSLPRLDRPFDTTNLVERNRRPAGAGVATPPPLAAAAEKRPWVLGGPVAMTAKVWKNGMTLRVKFLDGAPALQRRVMEAASEWTEHANLRFDVVKRGDAELRVSFEQDGSWSYVGTDALNVAKEEPTINLGAVARTHDDVEFRRVVLHEFGHALGLAAAQQSPIANIPWNRKAAYNYYRRQAGWERSTVDYNVFAKDGRRETTFGPPDDASIMYHPIPREATHAMVDVSPGNTLSDGDKAFIAKLYPLQKR